jgi:hypothetical protein
MLNLFQHPICKVYTKQAACPVGCRNKFDMTSIIKEFEHFFFNTRRYNFLNH